MPEATPHVRGYALRLPTGDFLAPDGGPTADPMAAAYWPSPTLASARRAQLDRPEQYDVVRLDLRVEAVPLGWPAHQPSEQVRPRTLPPKP